MMLTILLFLLLNAFKTIQYSGNQMVLKIFYSTMDVNSIDFLTHEFQDLINSVLVEHVHIELYPFAGCEQSTNKTVHCKQGQIETISNMHHLCAIHELNKLKHSGLEDVSFNLDALRYVVCTLREKGDFNAPLNVEDCSEYTNEITEQIETCEKENEKLLDETMEEIKRANLTEIPMVVVTPEGDLGSRGVVMDEVCRRLGAYSPRQCRHASRDGYVYVDNAEILISSIYNFFVVVLVCIFN